MYNSNILIILKYFIFLEMIAVEIIVLNVNYLQLNVNY